MDSSSSGGLAADGFMGAFYQTNAPPLTFGRLAFHMCAAGDQEGGVMGRIHELIHRRS